MAATPPLGNPQGRPSRQVMKASPLHRMQTYKFINEKLKADTYSHGDAYDDKKLDEARKEWEDPNPEPYLRHVKRLSKAWPHLRLLSDFMEVGTAPLRWDQNAPGGYSKDYRELERKQRHRMVKVCLLQYGSMGVQQPARITSTKKLEQLLAGLKPDGSVTLRLFVVEDLSRDVIELLGSHFKIEPDFWRAHILDYAWYNIRDYWRSPPNLEVISRRQRWLQLRFVRGRYFESGVKFKEGFDDAQTFNILRRPDDDQNNKAFWDKNNAKIGLTRSKATFWMRPASGDEPAVGVLLLDPTIRKGHPLWRWYRNWVDTPEMPDPPEANGAAAASGPPPDVPTVNDSNTSTSTPTVEEESGHVPPEGPPLGTFFDDFIYWASMPGAFPNEDTDVGSSTFRTPMQALLHLMCAEWLTIADYVKTRLNQIDWEVAQPGDFLQAPIDQTLSKLHVWRRFVPLYREMLSETLLRLFAVAPLGSSTAMQGNTTAAPAPTTGSYMSMLQNDPGIGAYKLDFELALSYMEEFQSRIDRLTHVATAAVNIEDSRRGISDNSNLQRLTYLATFFIPMSFVAALMSMQPDVAELRDTLAIWAEAAIPSGVLIMALIFLISTPGATAFARALPSWWFGSWRRLVPGRRRVE